MRLCVGSSRTMALVPLGCLRAPNTTLAVTLVSHGEGVQAIHVCLATTRIICEATMSGDVVSVGLGPLSGSGLPRAGQMQTLNR